ncbi:Conidiation protein 6-domain-containing protein [Roridomyces roridus]|uniref:Conidiation protein 6-domain-containing protein n=1 Tax=Roridomyces roridus TaxID=1738132 RepID=A0AAD7AYN2_9AGAR|nr:Conidiation protein 6-domain-containing protein [Roridomyces roridus]
MSGKNPANVAAGLKGVLARDNVSDEAKLNAEHRLEEMGVDIGDGISESKDHDHARQKYDDGKNENNVIGGHKANLKNPNTSEESKEHSREYLEEAEIN